VRVLLVLRHGQAEEPSPGSPDEARVLTSQGRRDAARMGALLRARGLLPAQVVCSPAARTRATAILAAVEAGIPEDAVQVDARIYDATAATLLEVVQDHLREGPLLLVGHNPGCGDLVRRLCAEPVKFPPAGLAVVELPARGALEGQGRLAALEAPPAA
jgi:phosphohistidine phosphatase